MPQLRRGGGHGEGPSDCTPNSPGVMSGGRAELCAGPARRLLADECLISASPTHCPQEPPLHTQKVLLSPRGTQGHSGVLMPTVQAPALASLGHPPKLPCHRIVCPGQAMTGKLGPFPEVWAALGSQLGVAGLLRRLQPHTLAVTN